MRFLADLKDAYSQIPVYLELRLYLVCHDGNGQSIQDTLLQSFGRAKSLHAGFDVGLLMGNSHLLPRQL